MHILENAAASNVNSTIGHAYSVAIPIYIRFPFQLISRLSPRLAGDIGRRVFFSPPRRHVSKTQKAMLAKSEQIPLSTLGGNFTAYSWGSGPIVLLAHGWAGNAAQLIDIASALAEAGYRAVAIDLPAHGKSGGRMSSLVHFARAIEATAFSLGPIHGIVTHSLGSAGAILAMRNGLQVKRTVLISPQAQYDDIWRMFRNGMGMSSAVWAEMVDLSEEWLGIRFSEVHPQVGAPQMTSPALILHGSRDRITPITEGRKLASLWPQAQFQEIDAGHQSILKQADPIKRVVGFIDG